ncbi:2TM domain-containing protein [Flavobacterium lindanitolerans]|jgi:sensor histidine kinase YesM|uniref:2TM domain-containing protein n=1 Tax=Flavobacterium lindanitolerans TaxID=428988 RepID=UPI0028088A84|nr:2TM domain-containing protein [Flavobacterium lindanitolerans]MDQ7961321.1 2TM domain-containing protein [Flavobacterium lindanitolerans]
MQKAIKYFFKTIVTGFVVSCAIIAIMFVLEAMFGRSFKIDTSLFKEMGYYFLYGIILTAINSTYFDFMNNRIEWKKYKRYRFTLSILGSVVLTVIGIFIIRLFIALVLEQRSYSEFIANENHRFYVVCLMITMVVTLAFHLIYFYKKSQENKVKEQKIIAGTASAKFETLKNQIDPHFLFNSLNVLTSLIEENQDNAQKFTTSLSKIYRYVLEQKDKELVSVEEELSFAKTYMNLLKMRFENSVFYELPESVKNPDAKVVPLSLQLLLENTVKHNIASETKPLHIRIYEKGDYLIIENDYQKKEVLQDRKGVGLQNIVDRYSIITNRKVRIEQTEKHFRVELPMLTKQIAIMETDYNTQESTYRKAQKKVEDIKGFYGNLTSYIVVNIGLAALNLITSPSHLWFLYPAIGWGIGVAVHGMTVFNYMPFLGSDWEEKKIRELMEKDKQDKWQ